MFASPSLAPMMRLCSKVRVIQRGYPVLLIAVAADVVWLGDEAAAAQLVA